MTPTHLSISIETAEKITADFIRQQYEWLKEDIKTYDHPDDIADAEKDLAALSRVYNYVGGYDLPA